MQMPVFHSHASGPAVDFTVSSGPTEIVAADVDAKVFPLYAAPPAAPAPAVPLTDERIDALQEQCTAPEWRDDTADGWHMGMNFRKFARDVLAAVGIGGGGK